MALREDILNKIHTLNDDELRHLGEYLEFLRQDTSGPISDEQQLAKLYAEFALEDQELADDGLADYSDALLTEDSR
jgi:rubrerythrin